MSLFCLVPIFYEKKKNLIVRWLKGGQKYETFTKASTNHKKQKNPKKQLLYQNEVSYDVITKLYKK